MHIKYVLSIEDGVDIIIFHSFIHFQKLLKKNNFLQGILPGCVDYFVEHFPICISFISYCVLGFVYVMCDGFKNAAHITFKHLVF